MTKINLFVWLKRYYRVPNPKKNSLKDANQKRNAIRIILQNKIYMVAAYNVASI